MKHVVTLSEYIKERDQLRSIVETRDEATAKLKSRLKFVNDIIEGIERSNVVEFKNGKV